MVYGKEPQLDPHLPSYTFMYLVQGDERPRVITVAADTEEAAMVHAEKMLNLWRGADRWRWQ